MTSFKPGDVVVRINVHNSPYMKIGSIWTVESSGNSCVQLIGYDGLCDIFNFRKATKLEQALR